MHFCFLSCRSEPCLQGTVPFSKLEQFFFLLLPERHEWCRRQVYPVSLHAVNLPTRRLLMPVRFWMTSPQYDWSHEKAPKLYVIKKPIRCMFINYLTASFNKSSDYASIRKWYLLIHHDHRWLNWHWQGLESNFNAIAWFNWNVRQRREY